MLKFLKDNGLLIACLLAVLVGFIVLYDGPSTGQDVNTVGRGSTDPKVALRDQERRSAESEDAVSTEWTGNEPAGQDSRDESAEILYRYRVDMESLNDSINILINAVSKYPHDACPSIIEMEASRENIYYMAIDEYIALEREYGEYRSDLPFIDTNLSSWIQVFQKVQHNCESAGYLIPSVQ